MPAYDQQPGRLDLSMKAADDFSALVDFSVSLVGHAVTATIHSLVDGTQVAAFTTTVTDAAAGQVNLSLSDAQTAAIAVGTYRWRLVSTQGALTRTYLEGFVEVGR